MTDISLPQSPALPRIKIPKPPECLPRSQPCAGDPEEGTKQSCSPSAGPSENPNAAKRLLCARHRATPGQAGTLDHL